MTRLKSDDIVGLEKDLSLYDRELVTKTGQTLRQIACRAAGMKEEPILLAARNTKVAVISVTAGQGAIPGFAGAVRAIIDHLATKLDQPKKVAEQFLEEYTQLAYSEAKRSFTLPGLGKLVVDKRKARMGRNPATGEAIKIPAKTVLKFRIAKAAKDAVLPPKK